MDLAATCLRELAHSTAEIGENVRVSDLGNRMNGVEPQPIEPIVLQPMKRIADSKLPDLRRAIVDCVTPRGLGGREERRRIAAEVISFRAKVIVDHIEKNHQPAQMGRINERLQILRASVTAVGGVPQHAVITPVSAAGKIRERHQFDCCEPPLRRDGRACRSSLDMCLAA